MTDVWQRIADLYSVAVVHQCWLLFVLVWSSQTHSHIGDSMCGTGYGIAAADTYSRAPLQISVLGSSSSTLQILQDNPTKSKPI